MPTSRSLTPGQGCRLGRITSKGVVANGVEYELDCIVYATGFEVGTDYTRRAGYELYGRDGVTLTQAWSDGIKTLHGMFSRGFPNCFIMGPQQSGFTVNFPHMLDEQAHHIRLRVKHAVDNNSARSRSRRSRGTWVQTVLSRSFWGREF